jgi:sugar phosphate isomerase/epimerase
MKKLNKFKGQLSRRRFIGYTSAAAVYSMIPSILTGCNLKSAKTKVNSTFGGVKIGAITYSFRDLPGTNAEETLDYLLQSGLSHCELMYGPIEVSAGAPVINFREIMEQFRPGGPGGHEGNRAGGPQRDRQRERQGEGPGGARDTVSRGDQQASGDSIQAGREERRPRFEMPPEARQALEEKQKELKEWRTSIASMDTFKGIRDLYNKAGVKIHIVKFDNIGEDSVSDEEHEYMFNMAKAMGAKGITTELDENKAKRLAQLAQKHGIMIGFHNHTQLRPDTYSDGPYFSYGKNIMANLDIGHYAAGNGQSALPLVKELAEQKRLLSIHLKDRTFGGDTVPFGEGDAQVAEILRLIQKNRWKIYCDIELEYPIPEGSDPLIETRNCVEFCRNVLT